MDIFFLAWRTALSLCTTAPVCLGKAAERDSSPMFFHTPISLIDFRYSLIVGRGADNQCGLMLLEFSDDWSTVTCFSCIHARATSLKELWLGGSFGFYKISGL